MYNNFNKYDLLNSNEIIKKYKIYTNVYHKLKKVISIVNDILKKHNINNSKEFVRALGNSMRHGRCPIKCTIYILANNKALVLIKDSGNGFDYNNIINKYKNNEVYYQYHGLGTKILCESKILDFNWDKDGSRIMIYYKNKSNSHMKLNSHMKSNSNIKSIKIKLNGSECNCKKCLSLQRRHIN